MIPLLDVNVLIPAHRRDHPLHKEMLAYVDDLRHGVSIFAISEIVLSGFIRIVTYSPVFKPPSTPHEAVSFAAELIASPKCVLVRPSKTHWVLFTGLVRRIGARGKLVPDAYLAAMALDQGFEFITNDTDFARFPGLTWRQPLAAQGITNPH